MKFYFFKKNTIFDPKLQFLRFKKKILVKVWKLLFLITLTSKWVVLAPKTSAKFHTASMIAEVRAPDFLGYRNNAKSRISKIDKQYFNLISMDFRKLLWCKNNPFCLKDEFLSFTWEI